MTTKWEVQAAVMNSGLSTMCRLLMHTLLTRAAADTAVIALQHSPSLSELAHDSGMDRRTVMKTLATLETEGWLDRKAPPSKEARKGAKTRYRLLVPVGAVSPQVGATDPQCGGREPLGVGATDPQPRGRGPLKRDPSPSNPSIHPAREEINAVRKALHDQTGKLVDTDWAERVIRELLKDRPGIRNRQAYLVTAIQRDKDPRRFLPTPQPPRYERDTG